MAKARFEIGSQEKHVVEVDSRGFPDDVKVVVDGRRLSSEEIIGQSLMRESDHRLGLKLRTVTTKEMQFSLEEGETHSVMVRLVKQRFGIKIEIYVDGNLEGSA